MDMVSLVLVPSGTRRESCLEKQEWFASAGLLIIATGSVHGSDPHGHPWWKVER